MVARLAPDQKAACSNHVEVSKWKFLSFRSTYNLQQPSGNLFQAQFSHAKICFPPFVLLVECGGNSGLYRQ